MNSWEYNFGKKIFPDEEGILQSSILKKVLHSVIFHITQWTFKVLFSAVFVNLGYFWKYQNFIAVVMY